MMEMSTAIHELERVLRSEGVHAALCFLNSRTPHRFTGIYRYDGSMLRSMHLVDAFAPDLRKGDDVAICDAYCAIVREGRTSLEFADARADGRFSHKAGSPVVCYCGVLLVDERREPFGTLCHFDVKPCDEPANEIPLLEAAAPMLFSALERP